MEVNIPYMDPMGTISLFYKFSRDLHHSPRNSRDSAVLFMIGFRFSSFGVLFKNVFVWLHSGKPTQQLKMDQLKMIYFLSKNWGYSSLLCLFTGGYVFKISSTCHMSQDIPLDDDPAPRRDLLAAALASAIVDVEGIWSAVSEGWFRQMPSKNLAGEDAYSCWKERLWIGISSGLQTSYKTTPHVC